MSELPPPPRWTDLFTNEKSFSHRWVGSRIGNRLGLHQARVRLSEACARVRKAHLPPADPALRQRLQRDGLLLMHDLLPPALYEPAYAEFRRVLGEQARRVPVPPPLERGFGAPLPNPWGFDRYDGGSLNRFVRLDEACVALRTAFADDGALAWQLRALTGARVALDRYLIYLLVHGPETERPDLQREVHCDTFHETFKLWYFFDDVRLEHGPFMYARGSHRNTAQRLAWERRVALEGRSESSSFRIDEAGLRRLGWEPPVPVQVPANTLVLANTRGFHCRADAAAGTERASVYINLRPGAFALRVPHQRARA